MTKKPQKSIEEVVRQVGRYPFEAYLFVQEGLSYTVQEAHGDPSALPKAKRHVTGAQLCYGLRDLAVKKWGMLSLLVLKHWNITATRDFGNIVFAMVENDLLQKSPADRLEDFAEVYDFQQAFADAHHIHPDD